MKPWTEKQRIRRYCTFSYWLRLFLCHEFSLNYFFISDCFIFCIVYFFYLFSPNLFHYVFSVIVLFATSFSLLWFFSSVFSYIILNLFLVFIPLFPSSLSSLPSRIFPSLLCFVFLLQSRYLIIFCICLSVVFSMIRSPIFSAFPLLH